MNDKTDLGHVVPPHRNPVPERDAADINEVRERLERLATDAEKFGIRIHVRPEHVRTLLDHHAELLKAPAIDLGQFRKAVDAAWACGAIDLAEASRLLALIDGQARDNGVRVDRGALQMALNVLRRAGKDEVAEALAGGVIDGQPTKGEGMADVP